MRILMLSESGDGLGVAQQMVREGHKVSLFIQRPGYKRSGLGLVNRVKSWRPQLPKTDLVVCDMVGFGRYEQTFKRLGLPAFSCSLLADKIELDRSKGLELLERVGVGLPESFEYKTPEDAKDLLRIWEPPGYVIKPDGNIATGKTLVAREPEIFEWALSTYEPKQELVVQQLIDGVEISTEGWFNGRDWLRPFNHTFEEKRLFPNGGPNTGCMGNVVIATDGDSLVEQTLQPLTPFLRTIGYRGPIDINTIVNADGVYALEITARMGYDAIEALMEGLQEPITDIIFETAMGVKKSMKLPAGERLIAVRVSVPPWPHDEPDARDAGMPILGLNEQNMKHIYLTDVQREGDAYTYAAGDGVLLKATAHGRNTEEARNRVYRTINNLIIPNAQFRSDIGSRVERDIGQLRKWGYLDV